MTRDLLMLLVAGCLAGLVGASAYRLVRYCITRWIGTRVTITVRIVDGRKHVTSTVEPHDSDLLRAMVAAQRWLRDAAAVEPNA